jgi:hypothetical protein
MQVREQEHDRHGRHVGPAEALRELPEFCHIKRSLDFPVGRHSLGDLEAKVARYHRRRPDSLEIVERMPMLPPDLKHVPEASCRDERRARPLPFEERIRGDRAPVREPAHVLRDDPARTHQSIEGSQHTERRLSRRGRLLGDPDPGLAGDHDVNEGAADVDADCLSHGAQV